MRPRKADRHLPPCLYFRHGRHWYVKRGKWTPLAADLPTALAEYARLIGTRQGSMPDLIDRALPTLVRDVAPSTRVQYTRAAQALRRHLAQFDAAQVLPKHVAGIKTLYADRPNTGNRVLTVLRLVFALAVEWQEVDSNPCVGIRRHREAKRTRELTLDEIARIYAAAPVALQVIIDVALLTGQRITDVLAIRLADLTPEGVRFQQKKTKKLLLVRWTPELRAAVDRARAVQKGAVGALTLFHRRGRVPSYTGVRDLWCRACARAGVADATLHDLRAASITQADRQGLDAQALAGHTTRAQTIDYIRTRAPKVVAPPSFGQSNGQAAEKP